MDWLLMGKPDLVSLVQVCPEVPGELVLQHLDRLEDRYFERFSLEEIAAHLRGLARLGREHGVELLHAELPGQRWAITILAYDQPGSFSLITGVLASLGFQILEGEAFTWRPVTAESRSPRRERRFMGQPAGEPALPRRRLVDHFVGVLDADADPATFLPKLQSRLLASLGELDGTREGLRRAQHKVNERVTARLARLSISASPILAPVDVQISEPDAQTLRLRVVSQDTPAFLYTFCQALSLHDLSIERVRIDTRGGSVEDEIDVVSSTGACLSEPALRDRLRLSVLLTKQFSHFLHNAPDPFMALQRFDSIVSDMVSAKGREHLLELVQRPSAMAELAAVLGASEMLWEEFVRQQYPTLLEMLGPVEGRRDLSLPEEDLWPALAARLRTASNPGEELNRFKDQEIYRIDLDHILGGCADFRLLARRLTRLAEVVLRAASQCVYRELADVFGEPHDEDGRPVAWAVVGLGKLGGEALGYASDIELLICYEQDGQTRGGGRILTNAEFFERFVRRLLEFIHAKQEGIFQIDLRLRPYGKNGPLACSAGLFETYYAAGGAAHSFERLALTRLRAVAGDPAFGQRLEALRDRLIYLTPAITLDELHELRAMQADQKRAPRILAGSSVLPVRQFNAKYSPGGLVDVEYAVQILQVLHGKTQPALRSPSIHRALDALGSLQILTPPERDGLLAAYDFLRRLINGLRMLRGNATDTLVPHEESDEFAHLARRMGYALSLQRSAAEELRLDLHTLPAAVRGFVRRRFGRPALPGGAQPGPADVLLSDDLPDETLAAAVATLGAKDIDRAARYLRSIGQIGQSPLRAARVLVAAQAQIAAEGLADRLLSSWTQILDRAEAPAGHFDRLLADPVLLRQWITALGQCRNADAFVRSQPDLVESAGLRQASDVGTNV